MSRNPLDQSALIEELMINSERVGLQGADMDTLRAVLQTPYIRGRVAKILERQCGLAVQEASPQGESRVLHFVEALPELPQIEGGITQREAQRISDEAQCYRMPDWLYRDIGALLRSTGQSIDPGEQRVQLRPGKGVNGSKLIPLPLVGTEGYVFDAAPNYRADNTRLCLQIEQLGTSNNWHIVTPKKRKNLT